MGPLVTEAAEPGEELQEAQSTGYSKSKQRIVAVRDRDGPGRTMSILEGDSDLDRTDQIAQNQSTTSSTLGRVPNRFDSSTTFSSYRK